MKYNLGAAFLGFALSLTALVPTAQAQTSPEIVRSEDFNVFWAQLRKALLNADGEALDALSLTRSGVPFRYGSLDPANSCEREAVKSYLEAKLDFYYIRPGGQSFREFLQETPTLDLENDPDVTKDPLDEYSLRLTLRFARNTVDNAWDLTDMMDDTDRVFSFSESAGGPASC